MYNKQSGLLLGLFIRQLTHSFKRMYPINCDEMRSSINAVQKNIIINPVLDRSVIKRIKTMLLWKTGITNMNCSEPIVEYVQCYPFMCIIFLIK